MKLLVSELCNYMLCVTTSISLPFRFRPNGSSLDKEKVDHKLSIYSQTTCGILI